MCTTTEYHPLPRTAQLCVGMHALHPYTESRCKSKSRSTQLNDGTNGFPLLCQNHETTNHQQEFLQEVSHGRLKLTLMTELLHMVEVLTTENFVKDHLTSCLNSSIVSFKVKCHTDVFKPWATKNGMARPHGSVFYRFNSE